MADNLAAKIAAVQDSFGDAIESTSGPASQVTSGMTRVPPTVHIPLSQDDQGHTIAGWWFGTFFIFPYIGKNNPN